jgi:trehalose 6-phosphate phosphatase
LIYAFSPEGIACLAAVLATRPLLAFDIDGTLAPLVDRPEDAKLPAGVQHCLEHLSQHRDVAIITGRGVGDARRMLTFEPRYLVGNHGAEGLPLWRDRSDGFARTVAGWRDTLASCASLAATGVALEDKRYSLSLHYRRAEDPGAASREIARCIAALRPAPRVISGKCVINLLPENAPDKGQALRALIQDSQCSSVLYVGDDDTDETVFGLHLPSVLTLRVEPDPESAAALYLRVQDEVLTLMQHIARQ